MSAPAADVIEARGRRDMRVLITDQLRVVLEQRSVRFGVVGAMLVLGSVLALIQSPVGSDTGWMFIVPVAISAIAAGLREGLLVAFVAAALSSAYVSALLGRIDGTVIMSVVAGRFALYGLTAGFLGLFAEAHYAVQSKLRRLATTDPLTRVSNIASFYEELGILESAETSFAVLVADIDDLKILNDRYGHQAGSAAIRAVANVLKSVVRSSDCVARYGGDEFVVILKDADRAGAQVVGNRIRSILAETELAGAPEQRISVSIGAALYGEDGTTSNELLGAADERMYEQKRQRKGDTRDHVSLAVAQERRDEAAL